MWGAILTVALQLVSWFLDRAKVNKEVKESFFKFVEQAGKDIKSAKLYQWSQQQIEEFKKKEFTPEPGQIQTMEEPT